MFFDQVKGNDFRLEAYFKGELVALRVRGSEGWVSIPLDRPIKDEEMVWKQADLPMSRLARTPKPEPKYVPFEEAP